MQKRYLPKIVGITIIVLIVYAIIRDLYKTHELNKFGKLGIAKLTTVDNSFKGKILYFEIAEGGKVYTLNRKVSLPYYSMIDSFYKYGFLFTIRRKT